MAGGPSTSELAAAVSSAGGLGFLAAGYKLPDAVRADIAVVRAATDRPFGVNVFAPPSGPADPTVVRAYADRIAADVRDAGAELGKPRHDDDHYADKLDLLAEERPAVASFTFGCPQSSDVARLHDAGVEVWVTVTDPGEAESAVAAGADALVVQGIEAGGHRGGFVDDAGEGLGLLTLLSLVRERVDVPLVAAGGIATSHAVSGVLAAGANAAAAGTAFLRCPEAGTSAPHRAALAERRPTGLTRAFSGRLARGIVNRWQRTYSDAAPAAYPEVHHLTSPMRARARADGDAELINLWAGQAHELAREVPAATVVADLTRDVD